MTKLSAVPLTAGSPEVQAFLAAWHEAERERFERLAPSLNYDEHDPKTAHVRAKYIALDHGCDPGRSGKYLVDRLTGIVYTIKGYGRPGSRVGFISDLTAGFTRDVERARMRSEQAEERPAGTDGLRHQIRMMIAANDHERPVASLYTERDGYGRSYLRVIFRDGEQYTVTVERTA